ncbi:hypothetical protein GCM10017714_28650 [Curtobacterium pusillum]|uniref:hypothetical protein n=1 Tax=Curtobacterium pusillum TaxID=69373 RepID=UPI001C2F6572|nr:hypothetical protein [Curtobacterium pusillum]GLK32995.1 hypothetical protein GCM10017610_32800 [Curtobacterium pusillum]
MTTTILKNCTAGVLGLALLAGGTLSTQTANATQLPEAVSARSADGAEISVTDGLGYVPGKSVVLRGIAPAHALVTVRTVRGGLVDRVAMADSSGRWALDLGVTLDGDAKLLEIAAGDARTQAWLKPGNGDGAAPVHHPLSVRGLGYTPGEPVVLTGKTSGHRLVVITSYEFRAGTTYSDADGNWEFRIDEDLHDRPVEVSVHESGHDGDLQSDSAFVWLKPGNPDGLAPGDPQLAVADEFEYTADEPATLHGKATPDAVVTLQSTDASVALWTRADADGNWSRTIQKPLDGTSLDISVRSRGTEVKTRIRPADAVDPVDPTDPVDPVDPTDPVDPVDPGAPVERELAATGGLGYNPGEKITVTGTANAHSTVSLAAYNDGITIPVYATANARGVWTAELPKTFTTEAVKLTIGGQGTTITTWLKPGNGDGQAPKQHDLAATGGLGYTPGEKITVTGTANAHSTVTISAPSAGLSLPASGKADSSGTWSIDLPKTFTTEAVKLTIGGQGTTITTWLKPGNGDGQAPTQHDLTITGGLEYTPGETITLSGTANAHSNVFVSAWNNGIHLLQAAAAGQGKWSIELPRTFDSEVVRLTVEGQSGRITADLKPIAG